MDPVGDEWDESQVESSQASLTSGVEDDLLETLTEYVGEQAVWEKVSSGRGPPRPQEEDLEPKSQHPPPKDGFIGFF